MLDVVEVNSWNNFLPMLSYCLAFNIKQIPEMQLFLQHYLEVRNYTLKQTQTLPVEGVDGSIITHVKQ